MSDYYISIRLKKDFGNLAIFADAMQLKIQNHWESSPTGKKYSYCSSKITPSDNDDLNSTILKFLQSIIKYKVEINKFHSQGGLMSIFISINEKEFKGTIIGGETIFLLHELKIVLEMDRLSYS